MLSLLHFLSLNTETTGTIDWNDGIIDAGSSVEKKGNIVYLSIFLRSIQLPDTWQIIQLGTLQNGFRPKYDKRFGLALSEGYVGIVISSNGAIHLQNISGYKGMSGFFGFVISYPMA